VRLLAATKQQPVDRILEAVAAGVDCAGENRAQEMLAKLPAFAQTELHFIGRLQKNKVKLVVGTAALIHSIDSLALAQAVSNQAQTQHIVQDVLIEVNIADEPTKTGFTPQETEAAARAVAALHGVCLRGLMCIPPPCPQLRGAEKYFSEMYNLYVDIKHKVLDNVYTRTHAGATILSMGMSGDFLQAARCGANLVRVGSAIFGPRE
jgi:pyridoxal phosphate enzyme (YggS family)